MARRQLDDNEKELVKKQIERIQKRSKWIRFQVKYHDLMLDEGLEQNYLKTIREYKDKKKEYSDELNTNEKVIEELERQLRKGVEIKEIKELSQDSKAEDSGENELKRQSYVG